MLIQEENQLPSKIEWLRNPITNEAGYSINPVKGLCPMACSYCYARRLYKRFHWDETIRYNLYWTKELPNKPSKIFVGSTFELFGDWVKPEWMVDILSVVKNCDEHTFIFLTKQPHIVRQYKFPDNCWIGVSTIGNDCRSGLEDIFKEIDAKTKFVSIEPLLDYTPMDYRWVDWVIIGAQTPYREKTAPQLWWIKDIVDDCDKLHIPVFLKNNLVSLFNAQKNYKDIAWGVNDKGLRQEFPIVK